MPRYPQLTRFSPISPVSPLVVTWQTERRQLVLARLRTVDGLTEARQLARWTDSRIGALFCLRARRRLEVIDAAILALNDGLEAMDEEAAL
jgi:hypothetical protein